MKVALRLTSELTLLRGVVFDLGPLRDTGYPAYEAFCKAVDELGGRPPSHAEFVARYHTVNFLSECGIRIPLAEFAKVFCKYQVPEVPAPFNDVAPFLQEMGRFNIKVALVTVSRWERTLAWLQLHGLDGKFDSVACEITSKGFAIEDACRRMGILKCMVCYVGDMGGDMHDSSAAKIVPVGITRGYAGAAEGLQKSGALLVVADLKELATHIQVQEQ